MKMTTLLVSLALAGALLTADGHRLPPGAIVSAYGAARAGPAAGAWRWPLDPKPALLRAFDPPARPWLSGHRGVDLAAGSDSAAVLAPAAGTISFAGTVVDRPVLTVDHGNGYRSSFEPIVSSLRPGMAVAAGDVLGRSLPGHCGGIPCVHWGVRLGDEYVNPLAFVADLRPSILLPPLDPAPGQERRDRSAGPPSCGQGTRPIGADQTMAEIPVIARPVTRVLISWVPS